METFERERVYFIQIHLSFFDDIFRKTYFEALQKSFSILRKKTEFDISLAIEEFTSKEALKPGHSSEDMFAESKIDSFLPCSPSSLESRCAEEESLYEALMNSVKDDETVSSSAGLARKFFPSPSSQSCSKTRSMEEIEKMMDSIPFVDVFCVKVLSEYSGTFSNGSPWTLRPDDIVRVIKTSEDEAVDSPKPRDGETWWLGHPIEKKRGFGMWFPSTFAAPLDVNRQIYLGHLLEIPVGYALFEIHLRKEHADENLDFWKVASTFEHDNFDAAPETLTKSILKIVSEFISNDAPRQINIRGESQKRIVDAVALMTKPSDSPDYRPPEPTIFNDAMLEVFRVMEGDSFKRFRNSLLFDTFLSKIEAFEISRLNKSQPI